MVGILGSLFDGPVSSSPQSITLCLFPRTCLINSTYLVTLSVFDVIPTISRIKAFGGAYTNSNNEIVRFTNLDLGDVDDCLYAAPKWE
ncbi:hypothetical protein BDR03DRAFT_950126 [Suillus americanus]|nr:hypothetical protein BDR03DRAFT_950126 [Suillus americanus]